MLNNILTKMMTCQFLKNILYFKFTSGHLKFTFNINGDVRIKQRLKYCVCDKKRISCVTKNIIIIFSSTK